MFEKTQGGVTAKVTDIGAIMHFVVHGKQVRSSDPEFGALHRRYLDGAPPAPTSAAGVGGGLG